MATRKTIRLRESATAVVRLEAELALRRAEFDRLAASAPAVRGIGEQELAKRKKTGALLEIAEAIVRIENEIRIRRAEFERLVVGRDDIAEEKPNAGDLKPLARTSSLPLRVQSVLDVSARAMTAHDIAAQIGEPIDSVRAALSKLFSRRTIDRIASGVYRSTAAGHKRAAGEDD
jgi:hypothetical protein